VQNVKEDTLNEKKDKDEVKSAEIVSFF